VPLLLSGVFHSLAVAALSGARGARRIAGAEERLHDAGVHGVDLIVAVDVVVAQLSFIGAAEG